MTLVEVLVAFVILGMVMAVIMRINATSIRNHEVSKAYLQALQLAESRLEMVSLDHASASLSQRGVEPDGLLWELSRQPYSGWIEPRLQSLPATPVEDRIIVSWGEAPFARELGFSRINLIYTGR